MAKKDKTKDLFYNAIDYFVMLVIIIGVIAVLGYRFELLFNKNNPEKTQVAQQETDKEVEVTQNDVQNNSIDILNNNDLQQNKDKETEIKIDEQNQNNTDQPDNNKPDTSAPTENNNADTSAPTDKPTENPQAQTQTPSGEMVEINIPAGTLPGATGQILVEAGLINDAQEFVNKAVELKLDRKLKSGKFSIKKGASLDEIVKAIAKSN